MIKTYHIFFVLYFLATILIGAQPHRAIASDKSLSPESASLSSVSLSGVLPGDVFPLNYISIPYSASLNTFPQGLTIEAWVKRKDASRVESVVCNGWQLSYCLSFAGGKVRLQTNGGASYLDSLSSVPAGAWTHIAATYDTATGLQAVYINGVLDNHQTYPGSVGWALFTPLGIGADLVNSFTHNYFAGLIDNVRIWSRPLSGAEIKANPFQEIDVPPAELVAEWRLNGNANDSAGGHHGVLYGGFYSGDGALPQNTRIPLLNATFSVDGYCTTNEYNLATKLIVSNFAPDTTVHLARTANDLWICFEQLNTPTWMNDNWAAVYIDPDLSRHPIPQTDDYTLELHRDGSRLSRAGDGNGDYTPNSAIQNQWDGMYRLIDGIVPVRNAEFRISLSLLKPKGAGFGLRLAQNWISGVGDDRIWPALSGYNQPATWGVATLGGQGLSRQFSGQILYQSRDGTTFSGVAGVRVRLVGSDPGGSSAIISSAVSQPNGQFSLTGEDDYMRHRLELDPLSIPKGYVSLKAISGQGGTALDTRTIDYGVSGAGTFMNNQFILVDALPWPTDFTAGAYFLIIAPQAVIDAGALIDFVAFKQRLGFEVEVASLDQIGQGATDITLVKNIRNFEISRYLQYGSRFRYLMLVGNNTVLPYSQMEAGVNQDYSQAPWDSNCRNPWATKAGSGWRTDWFYADLTSSYNSNGNGCLADGVFGDPGVQ